MTSDEISVLDRCLQLQNDGGGKVHAKVNREGPPITGNFADEWIIESHENLGIITLQLPTYGCLALLHPAVEHWEVERDDFLPLEQEE